ncbi:MULTISPECIES: phosphonate C-P lyase system protein PhnG [unclassified Afipia]|uniref:phosphonate C-P lyase system protein PhnG n=1 Tax=unclassified Afipia TaxID=2642050 RepID=UPI000418C2B1|nr:MULTISPECIES: phosphonate C-P lyase system protein PhnG [unclassified Afipia]
MTEPPVTSETSRRAAMSVLAHTPTERILSSLEAFDVPPHEAVRQPESGLVMIRGRIGGDGAPFNLGEASVCRAAVRLASGELGFGYVLGRDGEKARLVALCDALIQNPGFKAEVEQNIIAPLRRELEDARSRQAAETAATRVDFYTLVRGEG